MTLNSSDNLGVLSNNLSSATRGKSWKTMVQHNVNTDGLIKVDSKRSEDGTLTVSGLNASDGNAYKGDAHDSISATRGSTSVYNQRESAPKMPIASAEANRAVVKFTNLNNIQEEIYSLYISKQYRSCEILARLDSSTIPSVGKYRNDNISADIQYKGYRHFAIHILAECFYEQGKYTTAAAYYQQLGLYIPISTTIENEDIHQKDSTEMNDYINRTRIHYVYKYKEGQCYYNQNCFEHALHILEQIPDNYRTYEMNMLLGNLYYTTKRFEYSTTALLQAVQQNPYCYEAIELLISKIGIEKDTIMESLSSRYYEVDVNGHSEKLAFNEATPIAARGESIFPSASYSQKETKFDTDFSLQSNDVSKKAECIDKNDTTEVHRKYCQDIVIALTSKHRCQSNTALQILYAMNEQCPNNVYLLQQIGLTHLQMDDIESAIETFDKIRCVEPTTVLYMDQYAQLLGTSNMLHELSNIADSLLSIDDKAPESWVTLALYHQFVLNDNENALLYVDKAISMSQDHFFAHTVRGSIMLTLNRPEHAAVSYFRSNDLQRNVTNYIGLVDAYIQVNKFKEAVACAKEAYKMSPRDPRTITLVGLALKQGATNNSNINSRNAQNSVNIASNNMEKAKRTFRKALSLNPSALRPLFAVIDIYIAEKDYATCIELLKDALEGNTMTQAIGTTSTVAESIPSITGKSMSVASASGGMPFPNAKVRHNNNNMDEILCRMGDIYTMMEQNQEEESNMATASNHNYYQNAIGCYHKALGYNENHVRAQRALDKLEKIIRGMDPNDLSGHHHSGIHNPDDIIEDIPSNDSNFNSHHGGTSNNMSATRPQSSYGAGASSGGTPATSSYYRPSRRRRPSY